MASQTNCQRPSGSFTASKTNQQPITKSPHESAGFFRAAISYCW
jgi:hypothetical protein